MTARRPRRLYAWDLAHAKEPVIVCAEDPPPTDGRFRIPGDLSLEQFKSMKDSLPPDREIVFYSSSTSDDAAIARAAEHPGASYLEGGVLAWLTITPFLRT